VEWDQEKSDSYPVKIRIRSDGKAGFLADVAAVISKQGIDILSADADTHDSRTMVLDFTIVVGSTTQLEAVMGSIKRIKQVQKVSRITA
jgi:GTP pyrophosphokinase